MDVNMPLRLSLKTAVLPKIKFAASGAVATACDYGLYIILVQSLTPVISNIISYSIAILINFTLQKNFIFSMKRNLHTTFVLSILFSIIGLSLATALIYIFNRVDFFESNQYIIKLFVTAIIFFYNFYTKQYAFENRMR